MKKRVIMTRLTSNAVSRGQKARRNIQTHYRNCLVHGGGISEQILHHWILSQGGPFFSLSADQRSNLGMIEGRDVERSK